MDSLLERSRAVMCFRRSYHICVDVDGVEMTFGVGSKDTVMDLTFQICQELQVPKGCIELLYEIGDGREFGVLSARASAPVRHFSHHRLSARIIKRHTAVFAVDGQRTYRWTSDGQLAQHYDMKRNVVALATSAPFLYIACEDKLVYKVHESGDIFHKLRGHTRKILQVTLSDCGFFVFTASADWRVRRFLEDTGELLGVYKHRDWVRQVIYRTTDTVASALSRDGHVRCRTTRGNIYTASNDRLARQFSSSSSDCVATFGGHGGIVTSLALSACGTQLYTACEDHIIRLYQLGNPLPGNKNSRYRPTALWYFNAVPRCLQIIQEYIYVGMDRGLARISNLSDAECVESDAVYSMTLSSCGTWLYYVSGREVFRYDRTSDLTAVFCTIPRRKTKDAHWKPGPFQLAVQ